MGKTKLWRQFEKMVISGVRAGAEVVKTIPEICKFCGSRGIVRYGHYQQVQRWWCKDCKRKFVYNEALPRMKTPIIQVASALSSFYEGTSIRGIRRNIDQTFGNYPQNAAIYGWIQRFTQAAITIARDYKPKVGDTWVADETMLNIEGKKLWFWDLIDAETRFLLASHISTTRTTRDARALVEKAANKRRQLAKSQRSSSQTSWQLTLMDGIELACGADTKHLPAKRLTARPGTQLIERFHQTLKARTEVMKGVKTRKNARLILHGWLVFYNFLIPHEALGDKTPAQKAGIKFPYRNWLDIIRGVIMKTITIAELFTWAICPKCKHNFRLDDETYHITDRSGLPPNILSLLSDPVSPERLALPSELNLHQSETCKGTHKRDSQLAD